MTERSPFEHLVGGRLYEPDERDAAWPARGLEQRRPVHWRILGPHLDQQSVGACVPTSGAEACNAIGTYRHPMGAGRQVHRRGQRLWKMEDVLRWYAQITLEDEFPGNWTPDLQGQDTGTSANALGKVLRFKGIVDEWRHADDLPTFLSALQAGPVLLGIWWHQSMFHPDVAGVIHPDGSKVGGHEITAIGDDATGFVEIRNHWRNHDGSWWGRNGNAFISYADLEALLVDQGEGTTFERSHPVT